MLVLESILETECSMLECYPITILNVILLCYIMLFSMPYYNDMEVPISKMPFLRKAHNQIYSVFNFNLL